MVILNFPIPTAMVDRELDALIEQSREQRLRLLDPPAWCIEAFGLARPSQDTHIPTEAGTP